MACAADPAVSLLLAKSVAVTTVALRTGEFWKRLLRQGEAVRSRSPEQGVCQPPTVVLDNSGTDPALRAVLSRPGPPKRGGISPQNALILPGTGHFDQETAIRRPG